MDRLQEKNNFFVKLGALFGPMMHLTEHPEEYDEQERAETIARYCAEHPKLQTEFRAFSVGQLGHDYAIENAKFNNALYLIKHHLINGDKTLLQSIPENLEKAKAAVAAIPVPRDSVILEAGSPFTAYCVLKDLFEADTTKMLVWVDAYMDANIFHRFLRGVNANTSITIVTSEPRPTANARDRARWTELLDISRLFAQEKGKGNYRLIVHLASLHDRWLLLDDKRFYSLGGSAKDAGSKQSFTIARIDASPANLQAIQSHIDTGTEYFGPNVSTHV